MLLMPCLPYVTPALDMPASLFPRRAAAVLAAAKPVRRAFAIEVNTVERPNPLVPRTPEQHLTTLPSQQAVESGPVWLVVALALYVLGTLPFLTRFALSWRSANDIARRSQPIVSASDRLRLVIQVRGPRDVPRPTPRIRPRRDSRHARRHRASDHLAGDVETVANRYAPRRPVP